MPILTECEGQPSSVHKRTTYSPYALFDNTNRTITTFRRRPTTKQIQKILSKKKHRAGFGAHLYKWDRYDFIFTRRIMAQEVLQHYTYIKSYIFIETEEEEQRRKKREIIMERERLADKKTDTLLEMWLGLELGEYSLNNGGELFDS